MTKVRTTGQGVHKGWDTETLAARELQASEDSQQWRLPNKAPATAVFSPFHIIGKTWGKPKPAAVEAVPVGAGRETGPGQTHRALGFQFPRVENHPDGENLQRSHPRPHSALTDLGESRLLAMRSSAELQLLQKSWRTGSRDPKAPALKGQVCGLCSPQQWEKF